VNRLVDRGSPVVAESDLKIDCPLPVSFSPFLCNNGDEKQNGTDLKTINVSWCQLTVLFCFDGAPAISMTRQLISIYFDHFDLF
jgi:hypothetical protein